MLIQILLNLAVFAVFSAIPLVAEFLNARRGNLPGIGFDILCYEPFDYAYFLLVLAVFITVNINIARRQKSSIREAGILGAVIAVVWYITCFIAIGGYHLELGGKL